MGVLALIFFAHWQDSLTLLQGFCPWLDEHVPRNVPCLLNLEEMSDGAGPARPVLGFMEMHTQALANMVLSSGSEHTTEKV